MRTYNYEFNATAMCLDAIVHSNTTSVLQWDTVSEVLHAGVWLMPAPRALFLLNTSGVVALGLIPGSSRDSAVVAQWLHDIHQS